MSRTMEEDRVEFGSRRFLAMPLAGAFAWSLIALAGATLSSTLAVWALFILSGSTFYLGLMLSRITGEDLLGRHRPKNPFDTLFLYTVIQALLVYSLAIPFFLQDYTSLPLTVGILTGLMWTPFSWLIQHWIGLFHAVSRTASVLLVWYLFPSRRFVAVPLIIVLIYLTTILVLESRWRGLRAASTDPDLLAASPAEQE